MSPLMFSIICSMALLKKFYRDIFEINFKKVNKITVI